MSDQLPITEELLPMAANYSQHEKFAVAIPEKAVIVTIYEPNSKGGGLIPVRADVHKHDNDIKLLTQLLDTMKKAEVDMSNVRVTIVSNDSSYIDQFKNELANISKNTLPNCNPEIIHSEYGQTLTFNLDYGSHKLGPQVDRSTMNQDLSIKQQKNQPQEEQYTPPFIYP